MMALDELTLYKPRTLPRIRVKIAIANRKGGTGKTTMTTNIGAELALRGYRVGLIDLDSQGHAAVLLGLPKEDGLFKAMVGERVSSEAGEGYERVPLDEVVRTVPEESYAINGLEPPGALYIIPSSHDTHRIPFFMDNPFLFNDVTEEYGEMYDLDFILVDAAPTVSLFDGSVYMAMDGFLFITETETLSLDGINELMGQIKNFSRYRRRSGLHDLALLGVVPNKHKKGLNVHRENLDFLRQTFADTPQLIWDAVSDRVKWKEALKYRMTVRAYAPVSDEALDVMKLADRLERTVEAWLTPPSP